MHQTEQLNLESILEEKVINRRALLPLWIKIFIWFFMLTGIAVTLAFIFVFFDFPFLVSLYGLQDYQASVVGLIVSILFILKGIAAFGLWTQKDWGVNFAIMDAILGIGVCVFMMLGYSFLIDSNYKLQIRLELALLIPYLIKLQKIRPRWNRS